MYTQTHLPLINSLKFLKLNQYTYMYVCITADVEAMVFHVLEKKVTVIRKPKAEGSL